MKSLPCIPESGVRPQRITVLDIAADAGVSRATVSLVLREVPGVADQTRDRVLRSMQRLGYVYHRAAASLRTQRSHAIGLVISDITNPFFAEIIVAIEEHLGGAGYMTLLGNTSETFEKQERIIRAMREFPADGLLVCRALREPRSWDIPTNSPPIVAFARYLPGADYAGINNRKGAELAVAHLAGLSHRRIAFIGGDPERSTGRERLEGFRRAHQRLGLPMDPACIFPTEPNRAGGHEGLLKALDSCGPPTAALCFNDVVALGAMEALKELGRKPGQDFGIVGFNNVADAALSRPGLTTVDTGPARLGKAAAELLIQRIDAPTTPIRKIILQPRLVIRESCGAK